MDKGKLDHIVSEYIRYLEEKSKTYDYEIDWEQSLARHEEHTEFLVEQMNLSNDPEGKQYYRDCLFCLLYTSPSPRDGLLSRMPSSA